MAHDIIDNRDLKLIDELAARFPSSDKAKFAVGYFFLSGLEPLADTLYNLSELRLLIGNTTNKETIEQISEGYRRLEPVRDTIEALRYPKRSDIKARMDATVANMRESVELMEQTDASQQLVSTLVQLIAEKRLQVRVYNRGRLHAKAYIFDYTQMYDASGRALPRTDPGVAIIGSSNFTLSGISHNTELNVVVHGKDNHERLTQWFEELWAESDDFDAALMAELQQSWAVAPTTPYDIYMKTLYMLVRDRLEEAQQATFLWNDDITTRLADFQRVAVRQAIQTITHILRWYGYDAETDARIAPEAIGMYRSNKRRAYVEVGGRKQTFPTRTLQTVEYSIEETYLGLYDRLRLMMGGAKPGAAVVGEFPNLRYARYGLWQYVRKSKQKISPYTELQHAGSNLRGLMRAMLFKRFESSVYAFQETVRRMIKTHRAFLSALNQGIVPAGEEATTILHEADTYDELAFIDTLRAIGLRYPADDFNVAALRTDIVHDIAVLEDMAALVAAITPDRDAKLQRLRTILDEHFAAKKVLLFTQYADTAHYLFEQINLQRDDSSIEVIYSNDRDKARIVARFSPTSNQEIALRSHDTPIRILIATDVLSEGLNLQDCDSVINYDLHWNPVRLIQRFGRIDRIGTDYTAIYGFNFLPERALERNLGLYEVLQRRIREIHETIGEDAAVLDPSEALNEQAMYAIYTGEHPEDIEEDDDDGMIGLNEAEELLRQLREDNPQEYERIVNMRNGIRSGRYSSTKGRMVFCQAGSYQQLMLLDDQHAIVTRDISVILKALRCTKDEIALPVDSSHNQAVSDAKATFGQAAAQRRIEQQHTLSLTTAQRYILRELRAFFAQAATEDLKAQTSLLETTFRRPLTRTLSSELNALKRADLAGIQLVRELSQLYTRYNLDQQRQQQRQDDEVALPFIVCSEVLV